MNGTKTGVNFANSLEKVDSPLHRRIGKLWVGKNRQKMDEGVKISKTKFFQMRRK